MKIRTCCRCMAECRTDAGHVYSANVEYDSGRDLRYALPKVHIGEFLCSNCLEHHTKCSEAIEVEIGKIAEEYDVDEDEVYQDPEGYGISLPFVLEHMAWTEPEPDCCASCESPFRDYEEIVVIELVDINERGKPLPVELIEGEFNKIYLCKDCSEIVNM